MTNNQILMIPICIFILILSTGCSSLPEERQQYFQCQSDKAYQWQQGIIDKNNFFGCGDETFPCVTKSRVEIGVVK